jgi:ketosteroid isomerase-like protein
VAERAGRKSMTTYADQISKNKQIVRAFYEGGVRGEIAGFADYLHANFVVEAPAYLPWGGSNGKTAYLQIVLPQVGRALDFQRFGYDSITAEDDRVIALIKVGVSGTDAMINISEHWTMANEKAVHLWVAYFEPMRLMEQLQATAESFIESVPDTEVCPECMRELRNPAARSGRGTEVEVSTPATRIYA